jgi:DNA-binding NarL/FixJ family response regulator
VVGAETVTAPSDVRTAPLRVVLADDHAAYRAGLARLLGQNGIVVVAEVPNGEAAIRAVGETGPDVVVMDLSMPGLSGLEATRRLSERAPTSRVLVMSVSARDEDVTEAMLAGASGYVLKEWPVEDIITGVRSAAAGHSGITPPIATILLKSASEARAVLSDRELELLKLLSTGRSQADAAQTLDVDAATVRADVEAILIKLRVESRLRGG